MKQPLKDFLDRREAWESLFKAIPVESIFVRNGLEESSQEDSRILRSFCRMCHGGCGTLVHVSKGRVRKVEGDPEHPMNLGSLCTKGVSSIQQLYSPYRLHYPLKRVGKRGEGKWKRVSWEEALDYVAEEMTRIKKAYGPEAMAMGQGTGRLFFMLPVRLCNTFGTPNWMEPGWQQCLFPRVSACFLTHGSYHMPDYYGFGGVLPKCMLIWGVNPPASNDNGNISTRLIEARSKSGGKLIVVDPRFTPLASKADIWLPVRPGTDDALALGLIHTIVKEGHIDERFLRDHSNATFLIREDNGDPLTEADVCGTGDPKTFLVWDQKTQTACPFNHPDIAPALFGTFTVGGIVCKTALEKLRERVAPFTPEETSRITWVPAERVLDAARLYAKTKPASYQWGVAFDHTNNTIQTARAVALLPVLCGNLDVPGGNIFPLQLPNITSCYSLKLPLSEKLPPEQLDKQIGADQYPLGCGKTSFFASAHIPSLMKTIITEKPYPIKGMLVFGGNHFLGCADAKNLAYEAYKRLELLMVADLFMTPVAELADVVLPAAGWLERSSIAGWPAFCDAILGFQQKVVQLFDCKQDEEICMELGRRLGLGEYFPWENMDDYMESLCEGSGYHWEDLKNKSFIVGKKTYRNYDHLHTPSGKVELYSLALKQLGFDPLPFYREPAESPLSTPDLAREYPFVLTTGGRVPGYMHSEHRALPLIREIWRDPKLQINPEAAERLGIKEGDWVWIETPRGRCKQRATLTQGIHPQVVHAEHGWWFPEKPGQEPSLHGCWESNINVVTDGEHCDPIIGSSTLRGLLCKVYKGEEK
jgi:anaerobic selenocysteine-containing dehydrogenase